MEHRQIIQVQSSAEEPTPPTTLRRSSSLRKLNPGNYPYHRSSSGCLPPRSPSRRARSFQPVPCATQPLAPPPRPTLDRATPSFHRRQSLRNPTHNRSSPSRSSSQVRPPRRVASLPVHRQPPTATSSNRKRSNSIRPMPIPTQPRRGNSMIRPIAKKDSFVPRRSKVIERSFRRVEHDNDVWIQQVIVRGNKPARTYWKSVFGQEISKEIPTGATKVVYLRDIVHEIPEDQTTMPDSTNNTTTKPEKNEQLKKIKWTSLFRKKKADQESEQEKP